MPGISNGRQIVPCGHPPVCESAEIGTVKRGYEILGIRSVAGGLGIAPTGGRTRVIPRVGIVRIVGVCAVWDPVLVLLRLSHKSSQIVPHHDPRRCRIRQSVTISVQIPIGWRVDRAAAISAILGLPRSTSSTLCQGPAMQRGKLHPAVKRQRQTEIPGTI